MNVKSVLICAVMLAAGTLATTSVSAAELPSFSDLGLFVRHHDNGALVIHAFNTSPTVNLGEYLDLECRIKASGRNNPTWTASIYANGRPLLVRKSTAPDVRNVGTYFVISVSNWKVTKVGDNVMQCKLAIDGYNSQPPPRSVEFYVYAGSGSPSSTSNRAPAPIGFHAPRQPAHAKFGLGPMPNKHIRKCPTSVTAVSKINPQAFYAPFATASKPTNIPEGHLTLYLGKVETFNDTLLCTYATRAGNAKTTVEISCKNAQKTTNGAYCQ